MGCKIYLNESGYKGRLANNGVCPLYFFGLVDTVNRISKMIPDAITLFVDLLNCPADYDSISQYLKEKNESDIHLIEGIVRAHDEKWLKHSENWKYKTFLESNPAAYQDRFWRIVC